MLTVFIQIFKYKLLGKKQLVVCRTSSCEINNHKFQPVYAVSCKRFLKTMSGCQYGKASDEDFGDTLKVVLKPEEINSSETLTKRNLSILNCVKEFEKALEAKRLQNSSKLVVSEIVDSELHICSSNPVVSSLECVKGKSVGTQCSGSSEDCIHVFKYAWSEGEQDLEEEDTDLEPGLQVL